jgi:hypothetical protein
MFPESERVNADAAFSKLMDEVDMTLMTKNRDTFTQHVAKFRRQLTASNATTTMTASTPPTSNNALSGMAF